MTHYLSSTRSVLLSKEKYLQLVITREHTSASNSTKNVGTSTLEQRLGTLVLQDLLEGIQRTLVLDSLSGCHHHSSSNGVNGIGCKPSTIGDDPTQGKTSKEVIL